jgi:hypothetical protein
MHALSYALHYTCAAHIKQEFARSFRLTTKEPRETREPREPREGRSTRAGARATGEGAHASAAAGAAGSGSGPGAGGAAGGGGPARSSSYAAEDPPRPSVNAHPETLNVSLHEHGIGFFVPPGMVLHVTTCTLPQGALIEGEFVGDLVSEAGSVVIGAGASVYGSITADRIYIEGTVGSRRGQRSDLMGRAMIAAGAQARVNADMRSRAWSLHTGAQIWGSVSTLDDGLLGAKT